MTRGGRTSRCSETCSAWIEEAPRVERDWDPLKTTYRRSLVDLAALRFAPDCRPQPSCRGTALVHDDVRAGQHLHEPAGVAAHAELAATTLGALGNWQGSRLDDFRDEDPGRILHEMRYGEMTAFRGTSAFPVLRRGRRDALYVVLLDEYERLTGDRKLVRDLEHEARAALN